MERVRSVIFPLVFGALICGGIAFVVVPAAPQPDVVFRQLREQNHVALASSLRADPHVLEWRDSLGYTLLHWATATSDDAAVRLLLDAGADPNARDLRGRTPLHLAAMSQVKGGGDVLIKMLIARGACVDATDSHGATPLQFARNMERADLANALLAAGATEPANTNDLPEATDTRIATARPSASAPAPLPDLRPRRFRALTRRAQARLHALHPGPAAELRGNG